MRGPAPHVTLNPTNPGGQWRRLGLAQNVDWTPVGSLAGKPAPGSSLQTSSGLGRRTSLYWSAQSETSFHWLNPKLRCFEPMADPLDPVKEYLKMVKAQEYQSGYLAQLLFVGDLVKGTAFAPQRSSIHLIKKANFSMIIVAPPPN